MDGRQEQIKKYEFSNENVLLWMGPLKRRKRPGSKHLKIYFLATNIVEEKKH